MTKQELKAYNYSGYEWGYSEAGLHSFIKILPRGEGFKECRVLSSDLLDGSYKFMLDNNLSR